MITLNLDWREVLWWMQGGMAGSHLRWSVYDNREVKGISLNKNLYLYNILNDNYGGVVVKKDCDKEYTEAMNQVLSVVGKKLNVEETTN